MDLLDIFLDLLSKVAVGAVIAFIASYITIRLSLKRFHSEKWWEKKAEAYSAIIESLHNMKRYCDVEIDAKLLDRKLPEDRKNELLLKSGKAHDELKKRIDIGQFVISEKAVAQLIEFEKVYMKASDAQSWYEHLEERWVAIDDTLKRMRDIAKADLRG